MTICLASFLLFRHSERWDSCKLITLKNATMFDKNRRIFSLAILIFRLSIDSSTSVQHSLLVLPSGWSINSDARYLLNS